MMSDSERKRLGQLIKKASPFWIRTPKIGRSTPARFNYQIETDISQYPKLFRVWGRLTRTLQSQWWKITRRRPATKTAVCHSRSIFRTSGLLELTWLA